MQRSRPSPGARKKSQQKGKNTAQAHRSSEELAPQKTISELFASSKHRADTLTIDFPPSKRLKSNASSDSNSSAKPIDPANMYTFKSSSPLANGVIDLTSSPDGSQSGGSFMQSRNRRPSGLNRSSNFTQQMGAKKLVIKNLRTTPKANPNQYYDQIWNQLDAALSAIFSGNKPRHSLEELYRGVENVCRQDKAPDLFKKLYATCKDKVSTLVVPPLVQHASSATNIGILDLVMRAWSTWNSQMNTIRSIFYYLDRSYLLHSGKPSLEETSIVLFRDHVFFEKTLNPRILEGASDLVAKDREERINQFDDNLFQEAINMFHVLAVYTRVFEPKMLAESQKFFLEWANEHIVANDLAGYVEECHILIGREMLRCDRFKLEPTTKVDLQTQIDTFLIADQENELVKNQDVSYLMVHQDLDTLRQLYTLLGRKGLAERLRPPFEAFINAKGSEIVFDEERENDMVTRLLDFKIKLDAIWEHSFSRHEGLGHSLREAFESFINKTKKSNMTWGTDNPKPGEMIAKYVDMILKGGVKAIPGTASKIASVMNDEDMDNEEIDEDAYISKQLDQVLDLFRFVHGKAVFEAFYKRDLARRLLMGRSASADAEKSMLTRLKSECGAGFTHNLEQMFTDVELAREEISSYKMMLEERQKKPPVDLNVNVLSASAWPTYGDVALEIPPNIQKATAEFEQYYKSKHTGRRLAWKHALAHCQLKASFPKGNKEIIVSSFQAIVMLFFNDRVTNEPVGYSDIQAATNLKHEELERTLQSLACAKYRVLTKSPKGKDVNHTDTFAVNLNFADPKYRIKINQIQLKETKEENKETHERVAADRHYETQAAIVRIMKSRKRITHAELVAEVITATKSRGVLDPADIKKNIEKLIEKDYMEREEGNSYSYLA